MLNTCYHCGEEVPKGISLHVTIEDIAQPMCCVGCQAVAETIVENDLTDYYRFRTEPANKSEELVPEDLKKHKLLDEEVLLNEFAFTDGDVKETILTVEGISCAACAWLIEMQISKLEGVVSINVNATSQRATVKWLHEKIKLSEILTQIDTIGYHALPFKANDVEKANKQQTKVFIKRLGVSGILMMQVMMIAIGLYFGAFSDMAEHNLVYLRWTSMVLAAPVIIYGAFPFYVGAINALRAKRLSMDVPVSIAIILAFSASVWATVAQTGEVYFESITMFTFLLLIGKFLEFRARNRAAEVSANLLKLMPLTATKVDGDKESFVVAKTLIQGDQVIVKPGETIPADGVISSGRSQINEAMLSGEQLPITKTNGDTVFAGTINGDSNIVIKVKHNNQNSFLNQLIRLSEQSQAHKPKMAKLSDKIAQFFVALILLTAIGTAIYWHQHMPSEAFWITLSVLVATCPCALSLATPTALTCGTTRLNKDGVMVRSGHVIETIPQVDLFAFDKTGTLTTGDFTISNIELLSTDMTEQQVLAIAASLESQSEHPLAKAFEQYRDNGDQVSEIEVVTGTGVQGQVNGAFYQLGKSSWFGEQSKDLCSTEAQCLLAKDGKLIAAFTLSDNIRENAKQVFDVMHADNIELAMISGDNKAGCEKVAKALSIDKYFYAQQPQDKLETLKGLQDNKNVAMVGDGVNDSPVFGAAHVSIAMGSGTDIAKSGADVILLNNKLSTLNLLRRVAAKTNRIIKQNYMWAFGYNAIVLPLAVCGFITPYMAVIGMSLSSILVVTNSLRLLKK